MRIRYLRIIFQLASPAWLSQLCCAIGFRAIDVLNNNANERQEEDEEEWNTATATTSSSGSSRLRRHHYDVGNGSDVQELFFQQRLDHFRTGDSRTFQQRYFYSDRHVQRTTTAKRSLAFLCVGGEGPSLNRSVLIDSIHCSGDMLEFAKSIHDEYSIHLFALEHRYYGKSYPTFRHHGREESPVSNQNLVYLSSRQAIADIAHFISRQSHTGGAGEATTTWIAFGGSYPGMLAAWSRLKIPHLIFAAISSSAPVQQILDMAVYNAHVAKEFADPSIGGSSECLSILQKGHAELAEAVQNKSRFQEIGETFRLCDYSHLRNQKNLQLFLGDGVIHSPIQTNDPSCTSPLCNVNKICNALMNQTLFYNSSNMEALAWVAQRQIIKEDCVNISWKDMVRYTADPVRGKRGGLRSWLWQTCTEVGYYQTCEANSTCPFGRGYHPLSQDLRICQEAFHVKPWDVYNNVQETLEYYGGWKLQATRVLSITGSVDPWSELALQKSSNTKDRPIYQVPGASHHFWTRPVQATDSNEIQEAREIIFKTLRGWLDQPQQQQKQELRVVPAVPLVSLQ